jgi:hypothetical protein
MGRCLPRRPAAGSNFVDHAGLLTETCMLGNVALRAGKPIDWDGPNLRITNDQTANRLLHRDAENRWAKYRGEPLTHRSPNTKAIFPK